MRSTGWVTPRKAAVAALALVLLSAAGVAGLDASGRLPGGLVDDGPGPTAAAPPSLSPPSARPVLTPAGEPADPVTPLAVAHLRRLLATDDLGEDPGAVVLDARTGELLLERGSRRARTPASVAKLATGAAALVALGPDARLTTRVVAGQSVAGQTVGEVVLVGGGDATLTIRRPSGADYPRRASLAELADATATDLRRRGLAGAKVAVDDGLFAGPRVSPEWEPSYVPTGQVSPVSALAVDAGRVRPGSFRRSADPALTAGAEFARLLQARGIGVPDPVRRATAPAGARELASVRSPSVATLVETMLTTSDNDLAEAFCRLVARAGGRPASFAGGTAAVRSVLATLGVPTPGLRLLDGSGLARGSAIAPNTLARLLVLAGDSRRPALRPLLSGLPVAGFSGTLDDRFAARSAAPGNGVVRAKTGTLTGVCSLAGLADDHGHLLVFAVLADRVDPVDTLAARDALDRFAAALTTGPSQTD